MKKKLILNKKKNIFSCYLDIKNKRKTKLNKKIFVSFFHYN